MRFGQKVVQIQILESTTYQNVISALIGFTDGLMNIFKQGI